MVDFRSGKAPVLVATDVAGRGLHVSALPLVVNYDFPSNLDTYSPPPPPPRPPLPRPAAHEVPMICGTRACMYEGTIISLTHVCNGTHFVKLFSSFASEKHSQSKAHIRTFRFVPVWRGIICSTDLPSRTALHDTDAGGIMQIRAPGGAHGAAGG